LTLLYIHTWLSTRGSTDDPFTKNIPDVQPTDDSLITVTVDSLKSNPTCPLEPPKAKDYTEVVGVETAWEKVNSKKLKFTTNIAYTHNFGIL